MVLDVFLSQLSAIAPVERGDVTPDSRQHLGPLMLGYERKETAQ